MRVHLAVCFFLALFAEAQGVISLSFGAEDAATYLPMDTRSQKVTWYEAKELCAEKGRILPMIKTKEQLYEITKLTSLSDVWLGLEYTGRNEWRWSDGSSVTLDAWDSGEPNNLDVEKCGRLHRNGDRYNLRSAKCGDNGEDRWGFVVCGPKVSEALVGETAEPLTFEIECSSWSYTYRKCSPAHGVVLTRVTVKQLKSRTACKEGENFGLTDDGSAMWTDKGCRAIFTLRGHLAQAEELLQTTSTSITHGQCNLMDGSSADYVKCSATGDPHYRTFDDVAYSFQGACCYSMVKLCSDGGDLPEFEVQVCNDYNGRDPDSTKVTWTRSVTVIFQGTTYVLGRDNFFQVDGKDTFPPYSANGITVTKEPQGKKFIYVLKALDLCNKITWDGKQNVHIYMNKAYSGLVCGLCGNMNGQPDDDMFPYNGNSRVSAIEMANSYFVPDPTRMNEQCTLNVAPATCDPAKREEAKQKRYCGLLNPDDNLSPFYQALDAGHDVSAKEYLRNKYETCVEDRCLEPEPLENQHQDLCQVLEDINAEIIGDTGKTPAGEWRTVTGCVLDCSAEPNTELRNNANLCQNSCVDPDAETNCADKATFPACRCKSGMVRDLLGKCVDIAECDQCLNVEMEPGNPDSPIETLLGGQEAVLEPCKLTVKCEKGIAQYVTLPNCSVEANCVDNKCVCREGFTGDGYTCTRQAAACKTGWTSSGGKCFKVIQRSLPWEQATRTCCSEGAQMARVDTKADMEDLMNFMRSSGTTNTDFWVAGNTNIIPAGRRINSLPTSYDAPRYLALVDTTAGCYYAHSNGNLNVHVNCKLTMPAICEYANPPLDEEDDDAVSYEYKIPLKYRKFTLAEARKVCEELGEGFTLATAKTAEEQQNLRAFMRQQRSPRVTQTRLDLQYSGQDDVFTWGDGSDTSTGYTSWYRRGKWIEPNNMNNGNKVQRSVIYDVNRDGWTTEDEERRSWGAICQRKATGRVEAPTYLPINTGNQKVTWYKAKELCAKEGRVLPMIKTQEQLDEITKLTTLSDVWLGLRDIGVNEWRWSDGSSVYLDAWDKGEPNNVAVEKCGRLHRNGDRYNLRSSRCGDDGTTRWGFVVCGPEGRSMPHVWSPFVQISDTTKRNMAQVMELQKTAAVAAGRTPFACGNPLAVECQAMDSAGVYQTATTLNPKVLCHTEAIQCQENSMLNCANFRVRFFCPNEENLCQSLQDLGTEPCTGNQVCIPESNGCFTCQCPPGHSLDAHGNCNIPCGECSLWGDPHYTSLSGSKFDYQGKCTYLLNGICDSLPDSELPAGILRYSVMTKNVPCNPTRDGVTCLKRSIIKLNSVPTANGKRDFTIEYVSGSSEYWVNGNKKTSTFIVRDADGQELISLSLMSRVFKLKAIGGLYIESPKGSEIRVVPPPGLRDEMCGICGQCTDDYRLGNGTILTITGGNKLDPKKALVLGNSWMVEDPSSTDGECEVLKELPPPCSEERRKIAEDACKVILDPNGPFQSCFAVVNPQNFYEECEFDVCEDETTDRCEIMSSYVSVCKQNGVSLDSWRSADLCPMTCPDKMEYSLDINCQRVCGDALPDCSNTAPLDGCRCKNAYFYMAGQCVTETECGCKVTLTNGFAEISLKPNEEVFDTGCTQKIRCYAGGQTETIPYIRDPNSVCTRDEPPTLECARGYTMSADGQKCDRNIDQCADVFQDMARSCLAIFERPRIWRRALEKCNEVNATLMHVDIPDKFTGLKDFMAAKGIASAFVSGQVRVFRDGRVRPVLTLAQKDLIQYNNFDVSDFTIRQGVRTDDIDLSDLPMAGGVFAIAVVLDASGELIFKAVPRSEKLHFVCEERPDRPEDYEPTDFCSGSEPWNINGEYERASDLVMMDGCEMCLYPTSVRCERVDAGSTEGRVDGECGYNNGMLYKCDGADCADMKVSGTCPKDVNECAEGLHDCPPNSDCINNNGAYSCQCRPGYPLMIDGQCKSVEMCSMVGTSEPLNFDLHLKPFTTDEFGSLNYDCAMSFARTCKDLPPEVPFIDVMVNNMRDGNMADQSVTIIVGNNGVKTTFFVSSQLRKNGQLQVDGQNRAAPMSIGEVDVVAQSNDGTVVVQDKSERFRVIITPGPNGELALLRLELSSDYTNKMCGLCTMGEAGNNNRFVLTDEQMADVNRGGVRGCVPMTTPRPTTTTPVQTTTMFVAPQTTTLPPTTTEDPCAVQRSMCERLGQFCQIEVEECVRESCMEDGGTPCRYLGRAALNFCDRRAIAPLMTFFSEYCTDTCKVNNQVLRLARVGINPSCADPRPDLIGESAMVDVKFQCMCDYEGRGEVQENGRCIPRSECGCTMGDDYRQAGEVWSAPDCSMTYECRDGEVIETPRTCSDNSRCINRDGEMVCECVEGYKGDGNMPDGCKKGVPEKEKTCYEMRPGQTVCYCNDGYAPTCDGCQDINECALNSGLCDKERERCENKEGGYQCVCREGYRLSSDNTCVDENECMRTDNPCPANSECVNLPGSYSCQCCAGYDATNTGTCVRNEQRVPTTWIEASKTASGQPLCCAPCPYPQCINPSTGPSNGCYENSDGTFKNYPEFRFLYEEYCLRKLGPINPNKWTYGNCPDDVPQATESTTPAPAPAPSQGSGRQCSRDMCNQDNIPPQFYNNNPVCGPSGNPNQQTYPTYCAMLIALCNVRGGPDNFDPASVSANQGSCENTTPTTTAVVSRPPPDFGEWGPWSECTSIEANKNCGRGVISRSRQVKDTSPADRRKPLPSELYQADGCFLGPCPTDEPSDEPEPRCPELSICSPLREPVCAYIGNENPRTYPSQCYLDVMACERNEPKTVLYSGDCQPDDANPKRYCDQPPRKVPTDLTHPRDPTCKASAVELASCSSQLCRATGLSSTACCVPDQEEMVDVIYVCESGTVEVGAVLSPISCKCEEPSEGIPILA